MSLDLSKVIKGIETEETEETKKTEEAKETEEKQETQSEETSPVVPGIHDAIVEFIKGLVDEIDSKVVSVDFTAFGFKNDENVAKLIEDTFECTVIMTEDKMIGVFYK